MDDRHTDDVVATFVAEVRREIARWGYIELDELPAFLGVQSERCQELIRRDDFPAPAMAGGRDVLPLWERDDIERWCDEAWNGHQVGPATGQRSA